jgi:hypothetical protein
MLAAFIIGLLQPQTVFAGLSSLGTNTKHSPDGRFILVNICPESLEEELAACSSESGRIKTRSIRATYPKSGLYRNDDAKKPLWTYEGRWAVNPIIAPDGQYVIFEGDWTWDKYGLHAVEFTRNGKTIREYLDVDMITQWRLKALLNGRTPPSCTRTYFDSRRMTYTMRTSQGEEFTFDVTTGDIVHVDSPFPTLYGTTLAGVATVVGVIVCWWRKSAKRNFA